MKITSRWHIKHIHLVGRLYNFTCQLAIRFTIANEYNIALIHHRIVGHLTNICKKVMPQSPVNYKEPPQMRWPFLENISMYRPLIWLVQTKNVCLIESVIQRQSHSLLWRLQVFLVIQNWLEWGGLYKPHISNDSLRVIKR